MVSQRRRWVTEKKSDVSVMGNTGWWETEGGVKLVDLSWKAIKEGYEGRGVRTWRLGKRELKGRELQGVGPTF